MGIGAGVSGSGEFFPPRFAPTTFLNYNNNNEKVAFSEFWKKKKIN